MAEQITYTTEQIMEQAQVFASAWSLVGGCFDSGDQLEVAEQEKTELHLMVTAHSAPEAAELPCEFIPEFRRALLWLLWHHQGGSSPVGQPIRAMLGIGQQDRLTDEELAEAKAYRVQAPITQAATGVLAERRRQIEAEDWTPEHDDEHGDGQLAVAAGYYALACGYPHERDIGRGHVPSYWPWDSCWWKPKDRRSNLVRAGALILAEIERLDRADQGKEATDA